MFTFGFYDSLDGDRKYTADQMGSVFDGIIVDGVFANVGDKLMVVPGSGLQVIVKTGRAWFDHTWSLNDAPMPLEIETADILRSRYDAVVLEINKDIEVRENSIKVIKGDLVTGTKPVMIKSEDVNQYPLAYIQVLPTSTNITSANIEIVVGKEPCPFVTAPLEKIDISDLFNQWSGQFNEWFDALQEQLSGNVATNLQNQITEIENRLDNIGAEIQEQLPSLFDGAGVGSLFTVYTQYKDPIKDALLCNGGNFSAETYPELADIIGTANGGTITFTSIGSLYNIPSGTYPIAYNPDQDLFVHADTSNNRFVVYRKNATAEYVTLPSGQTTISTFMQYTLMSFGNYIFIMTASAGASVYNLQTKTWSVMSPAPSASSYTYKWVDCGDYLLTRRAANNSFDGIVKASATRFVQTVNVVADSALGYSSGGSYVYPIINADDTSNQYAYLACPIKSTKGPTTYGLNGIAVFKVPVSEINNGSTITLDSTKRIAMMYGPNLTQGVQYGGSSGVDYGGFIAYNRYYGRYVAGNNNVTTLASCPLDSSDHIPLDTSITSQSMVGTYTAVRKIGQNLFIAFANRNPAATSSSQYGDVTAVISSAGAVNTTFSLSKISVSHLASTSGPLPTSTGPINDLQIGLLKLPTITLNNALVYIRTKGVKGGND